MLEEIIAAHVRGTRYRIHVDAADGLLYAGEPGVQLTWMDAKVGERVVTPRTGKPVEVNALWMNAAASMSRFSQALGREASRYELSRSALARAWRVSGIPKSNFVLTSSIPAQALMARTPRCGPIRFLRCRCRKLLLPLEQQRAIVDVCARELLTSFGLRSLAQNEAGYRGHYAGNPEERDAAYHQGTVWGWLLGPFALAHLRVYQDAGTAMSFLEPMFGHIRDAGLGTASEIFDGDAPFTPNGCIAQAWTVGEILRAWRVISTARDPHEK